MKTFIFSMLSSVTIATLGTIAVNYSVVKIQLWVSLLRIDFLEY
jgi:hypothetical protein